MKKIIRFKHPVRSLVTSESLLAFLMLAGLVQIGLCFSAGSNLPPLDSLSPPAVTAPAADTDSVLVRTGNATTNANSSGFPSNTTHG